MSLRNFTIGDRLSILQGGLRRSRGVWFVPRQGSVIYSQQIRMAKSKDKLDEEPIEPEGLDQSDEEMLELSPPPDVIEAPPSDKPDSRTPPAGGDGSG